MHGHSPRCRRVERKQTVDYSGWSGTGAFAPPVAKPYAGFWIRLVAYVFDAILLFAAQLVLYRVLESDGQAWLANFCLGWIYFAACESELGGTPGKLALGLQVTDQRGDNISFLNATGRYFAKTISALILCIGFLMIAWDGQKQGLHDKLAGTYVRKASRAPQVQQPYINM